MLSDVSDSWKVLFSTVSDCFVQFHLNQEKKKASVKIIYKFYFLHEGGHCVRVIVGGMRDIHDCGRKTMDVLKAGDAR